MSSGSGSLQGAPAPVAVVTDEVSTESSEETPMSQWSSLVVEVPEENEKRRLQEEGLYSPPPSSGCAPYLVMSDSAVLTHPYYNYPAVEDPGIEDALLLEDPPRVYPEDGQDLYLQLCADAGLYPVRLFLRGLLAERIDLSYYGVEPAAGVRAMCLALARNRRVRTLVLAENWLSDDACFHLGRLLLENSTITELDLTGCRIGLEGVRRVVAQLPYNRSLRALYLGYNCLKDAGMREVAGTVEQNSSLQRLGLACNSITQDGARALTEALDVNNVLTHLDLSWNQLFTLPIIGVLRVLALSKTLVELDLSWNSLSDPKIAVALRGLMVVPTLQVLNLSNNKLQGEAVTSLAAWIFKSKRLRTLDLSYNPLTPKDAVTTLSKLMLKRVKLQNLLLEGVWVDKEFMQLLGRVRALEFRRGVVVRHGGVLASYAVLGPDRRELLLRRAFFLGQKPKKKKVDIAVVLLTLEKERAKAGLGAPAAKDLADAVQAEGAQLDGDLVEEMAVIFPGPKTGKGVRTVDLSSVAEYVHRLWPDARPPPTPPPTPPPPEPEPKEAKGKGKGKGKKK